MDTCASKRMGAARLASRTPGTVPGLPHPHPHGRHTEAQMEPRHDGSSIPNAEEREVALLDLIEGVTDPLFVTQGSKRDSMRVWGARLQAALGLECLRRGGLSREE